MRKRYFFIFLIFLAYLYIPLSAQRQEQNVFLKQLGSQQGLQNSTVYSILQDDYGFLWFGTENGLVKYNGLSYTLYEHDPLKKSSISGNLIFTIVKDKQHQTWVCTNTGFDRFDPLTNTFIHYPIKTTINGKVVLDYNIYCPTAYVHSDGTIYVSEGYKGLFKVNAVDQVLESVSYTGIDGKQIAFENVITICESKNGNMWFGTKNSGLFQMETSTGKALTFNQLNTNFNSGIMYFIFTDSFGRIFLSCKNGVYTYDENKRMFLLFDRRSALSISENGKGDIWFGTQNNGILILKKGQDILTQISAKENSLNGLSSADIRSIYEDKQHNVWIGTFKGGINYIPNNNISVFKNIERNPESKNTLSFNSVDALYEDNAGSLWMGTDGGGLNMFNKKTNQFVLYDGKGNGSDVLKSSLTIWEDEKGTIWTGGYLEGLCKLDKNTNRFYRYKNKEDDSTSIGNDDVRCIFKDSKGKLWIATNGGGLNLFNRDKETFKRYTSTIFSELQIASNYCLTVFEDSQQRLWIGTYEGFSIINSQRNKTENYRREKGLSSLSSNWIYCIHEDKKGRIWLGTDYGLNLFDETTGLCTVYLKKDGLPNNVISKIIEDANGYLWISTKGGLCKFDPNMKTVSNYTVEDGLQSNQFNVSVGLKGHDGIIYFGGTNGLTYFNPGSIRVNTVPPSIYITSVTVTDSILNVLPEINSLQTTSIKVDYEDAVIMTFNFIALNFIQPQKNQYSYFLEGFDRTWHESNESNSVTYTNLNPGTYIFKVKASNNDGVWNETGARLIVVVLPPWYKTWWFQALVILVMCAIIIGIYLIRIHSIKQQNILLKKEVDIQTLELQEANNELIHKKNDLEKLNQMKNRFFTIIGHDLKNPVLALTMLTDLFEDEFADIASVHQKQYIKHISNSSKEIKTLVLNLFEWAKTQNETIQINRIPVSIDSSCNKVIELLSLQIKQKSLIISNIIDDNANVEVDKNMFETIIRNVLTNAIKYSTIGGEIILSTRVTKDTITLVIKDTGVGMEESVLSKLFELNKQPSIIGTSGESGTGLGMIICSEFVALNEGKIWAESEINNGATFYITFPISFETPKVEIKDVLKVDRLPLQNNETVIENAIKDVTQELIDETNTNEEILGRTNSKPNVLLVEDNFELREAIQKVLLTKFNVLAFENGSLGLKAIQKNLPDLVITDIMMPVMDGITLSKKLKKDFNTCHIPIILLTSLNEDEDKLKGIESGADDYIVKPFKTNLLLSKASNLIDTRKILQKKFISEVQAIPSEIAQTSIDEIFLLEAITLIESHIEDTEFSVDTFSAALNMSQSSLLRKLKGITGQSPNQFIRSIRLKRAAQLLKQSDLNVSEVCYKVGFNDVKYFRQCYQKQFGVNPGDSLDLSHD